MVSREKALRNNALRQNRYELLFNYFTNYNRFGSQSNLLLQFYKEKTNEFKEIYC